jgi:hypothetical protein
VLPPPLGLQQEQQQQQQQQCCDISHRKTPWDISTKNHAERCWTSLDPAARFVTTLAEFAPRAARCCISTFAALGAGLRWLSNICPRNIVHCKEISYTARSALQQGLNVMHSPSTPGGWCTHTPSRQSDHPYFLRRPGTAMYSTAMNGNITQQYMFRRVFARLSRGCADQGTGVHKQQIPHTHFLQDARKRPRRAGHRSKLIFNYITPFLVSHAAQQPLMRGLVSGMLIESESPCYARITVCKLRKSICDTKSKHRLDPRPC